MSPSHSRWAVARPAGQTGGDRVGQGGTGWHGVSHLENEAQICPSNWRFFARYLQEIRHGFGMCYKSGCKEDVSNVSLSNIVFFLHLIWEQRH